MLRVLPLLILLLAAAPAQAQTADPEDRAAAVDALEEVRDLADGSGVRTGRELTTALRELASRRDDLGEAQRRVAGRLLSRPDQNPDPTAPESLQPYQSPITSDCTAHFCVHWVENTNDNDAPPDADDDDSSTPPFIEVMKAAFEESYAVENLELGWQPPISDATRGGDDGKTDVYVKDIGEEGFYGYANTDPGQSGRNQFGFLVMDDDYAASEFPGYSSFEDPLRVTAAHEYNHVLQFGYDVLQDDWMFESTATWSEEKVFPEVDDYLQYLVPWADLTDQPLTQAGSGYMGQKQYGSAIWNHWLETQYDATVVREAWARSHEDANGGGFAPSAYDRAIKAAGGAGFAAELNDFFAATAEWDAVNSEVHEGAKFAREVDPSGTLIMNGPPTEGTVNHTTAKLYDVPSTTAAQLHLTGGLPPGVAGSIALVGFDTATGTQARVVRPLDSDGRITATLDDPGRFERLTAVISNVDTSNTGEWSSLTRDWAWTRDAQPFSLAVSNGTLPVDPTPTPSPTPTPTVTPTPTPTPATSVRLSRSTTRIGTVARKGVLALFARTSKAGRLTARATVDRATARRLKVGRRTTSAGTGRRTASAPARVKINVRLTRKLRAALKRRANRRRTMRVTVAVTFVPADGTRAVRRTLSILLRP